MAAPALGARAAAEALLSNTIREITRYKDGPNPNQRLLQAKLDKLYHEKDELFKKHCFYAEKAGVTLSDETMQNYINPLMDDACDLADELELIIVNYEATASTHQQTIDAAALELAKANEVTVAEGQCNADELTLRHIVDAMKVIVDDDARSSKEDSALVMSHLPQVEETLANLTKSWNSLKSLQLSADKLTQLFAKQHEVNTYVKDNVMLATAFVNKVDPDSSILKPASSSSSRLSDSIGGGDDVSKLLKMEKAKYPTFSGDIRTFARFKREFNDFVVPSHQDPKSQVYVLKQTCLKGDVRKLVENMSDLNGIWERLESRYGDTIDIVSVVIKSVQDFTFSGSDHDQKIVNLVDTLERGVEDLNAIQGKHHIANAFTVKLLEEKIPRQILTRWLQNPGSKMSADQRFDQMFEFLKQERKQAERLILVQDNKQSKKEDPPKKKPPSHVNAALGGGQKTFNQNNRCLLHPEADHLTRKCRKFLALDVEARGKALKDNDGCRLCLSKGHGAGVECPFTQTWTVCGINNCQMFHSRLVHGCTISGIGCHAHITCASGDSGETLLLIESVNTTVGTTVAFWDNGSTITLVAQSFARRNNLRGVPISYDLTTVDGTVTVRNTTLYEITIIDRKNNEHCIKALEIEEICGELKDIDTSEFAQLFNKTSSAQIQRPQGKIDILIGSNYLSLHPTKLHSREGLVLFSSYFGTGKLLGGTHVNIQDRDVICSSARVCAAAHITNIRVHRDLRMKPGLDFITTEGFGVEGVPRCNKCKSCKVCTFESHQMSRQEQLELDMIRQNMTLGPIEQVWTVSYPCRNDPSSLKENRSQALVLAERTESV